MCSKIRKEIHKTTSIIFSDIFITNFEHFLNFNQVSFRGVFRSLPHINPFVHNAPFLFPLKISKNLTVF